LADHFAGIDYLRVRNAVASSFPTVLGALVGSGIREEKAKFYAEEIGQGKILLSVAPHSEAEANRIESEWLDRGSEGVIRQ
jgi:hypothetical protein